MRITIRKQQLIAAGLWAKKLNNEKPILTDKELKNFQQAYISDSRRPTTDIMKNQYDYDFSDIVLTSNDIIVYNPIRKEYYCKSDTSSMIDRYLTVDNNGNKIGYSIYAYLQILGKNKAYNSSPDEPTP